MFYLLFALPLQKTKAMSKKQRLHILSAFFIILHMMFLNATLAAEINSGFDPNDHISLYNQQQTDTVPESLPDTLIPVQTQNAVQQRDTLIPDTIVPVTDTIATDVDPEPIVDPDTIQVETLPAPSPPPVAQPVQPVRTETHRTTFDRNKAYWVEWDSLLLVHDNQVISRVFSAREHFGTHSLKLTSNQPEPIYISRSPSKDLLTLWIILSLILIGITRYLFPLRFKENFLASFTGRYFNQLDREGGLMNNWASFFLFLNFLLVFSLLIYLSMEKWGTIPAIENTPFVLIISYILIAITTFYLIKYIIVFFIAWVFKTKPAAESYFLNILLINQTTGIILLPVLVISIYNPGLNLIIPAWILLILINLFKMLRGAYLGYKTLDFSAYYLILYLCAIEFAPLILILKFTKVALSS
jgi:hypothetical protein